MAHLLEKMAYVGETPWHDLGNQLPAKQPIEVWAKEAGMDWTICATPVRYMTEQAGALGSIMSFEDQRCFTAVTPRHHCPWSVAATKSFNPRKFWSSTGI